MPFFREKCTFYSKINIISLTQTPYLCGILFCKLRFISGKDFIFETRKEIIENHNVIWNENCWIEFHSNINKHTRILSPCLLRISVRKQLNKGEILKIGYADINLAEFCAGEHKLKFHLRGYNSVGLDNSILDISIDTRAEKGNIVFKPSDKPTKNRIIIPNDLENIHNDETDLTDKSLEIKNQALQIMTSTPNSKIKSKIKFPENIYSSWFKGDKLIDEKIENASVRGSPRITATRVDIDQITDQILSQSFLCLQPADTTGLQLLLSDEGKPILGHTLSNSQTNCNKNLEKQSSKNCLDSDIEKSIFEPREEKPS